MLSKHDRAYNCDVPASKRLKANLVDLYATNAVPANRVQELINDAAAAGATECKRFSTKRINKNCARDLQRNMLKYNGWPAPYVVDVPCKNPKTNNVSPCKLSMMLPSEALEAMASRGDVEAMYTREGMDPKPIEHLQACEGEAGHRLAGIGL